NNLSKAVLRVALEQSLLHQEYFPSFEIFMDELRDYRFSKEDFSHPTAQATAYIWERFKSTYFQEELLQAVDAVET
ncbi:MAG: GSCFA domain-containing protein, partial [Bacteroidia bacterium]